MKSSSVTLRDLYERIFASIKFITRGVVIPERVVKESTEAAVQVIVDYLTERTDRG